jgi:hypothetical protein
MDEMTKRNVDDIARTILSSSSGALRGATDADRLNLFTKIAGALQAERAAALSQGESS